MDSRPKVCDLLDAMEKEPAAAGDVALSLARECLSAIVDGRNRRRAWESLALYAQLAAHNESYLEKLAQLTVDARE